MSFFTALLEGAGGYGRGRQQGFENDLARQSEEDRRAQLDIERQRSDEQSTLFKQQQQDYRRNRGIDPATGKPFIMPLPLTQIRPDNQGKGGAATLPELYAHQNALAKWYTQTGQIDLANQVGAQAAETQRQLVAQQTQEATFGRDVYLQRMRMAQDAYNQSHQDQRQKTAESFQAWLRKQPTYSDLNPTAYQLWEEANGGGRGSRITPIQAAAADAAWHDKWAKATKPGTTQLGVPLPPLIPAAQQAAAGHLFSSIDQSPNPIQKATELANGVSSNALKALIIERGRVDAMKKQAQGGGSDATLPFQGVSYTNPVAQADLAKTSPQMQDAFTILAQFDPVVTSVMHGIHVGAKSGPNMDPHYAGRAVDVGALGGITVGMNPPTWNAIVAAIASREFSRIGTLKALSNNAQLQAFAKAHGVDLIEDEGSGAHVHFEVK